MEFITVKVGKLPGTITEIALNGGRTVQDALDAAGIDASGYEIRVNGAPADTSATLTDGSTVLVLRKITSA